MNKIILVLALLISFGYSNAQTKVKVIDSETSLPIEGVQVTWTSTTDDLEQISISDKNGIIVAELPLPLNYQFSHISYKPISGRLDYNATLTISMTPDITSLDEVVVTGQFAPQSINQSVHTVKAIDRARIENQGAVDLADVLSNNLNITLTPNKSDGRTSISMLGLDGQYVKILIDGVPFAGVDGNGNNVDISQINLNIIERIEIVEGPMAVNYGANALGGVINLITKKSALNSISIQEETVSSEYGLKQGRHIQTLSLGHKFKNGLLLQGNFQRNDFKGFRNGYSGEDHSVNDNTRGFDWHPKLQYSTGAAIGYKTDHVNINYRYSFFRQTLNLYSRVIFPDEHPSSGLENPFSLDDRNITDRFNHSLNISGRIKQQVNYNIISAYTGVEMEQLTLRKRILTDVEEEIINSQDRFLNSLTSRGNFTNFFKGDELGLELGYEYTHENVKAEDIDGTSRNLDNIAGFASIEWLPTKLLTVRPGLRFFYNSIFSSSPIYSLNVKYQAPHDFDIRASVGRSYRTPNLTELYFYFVDANHDVRGNAGLNPEDGYGISVDIKKNITAGKTLASSSIKLFYNDIQDQITLSVVNQEPLQFQYINIDRFKSKGVSFSNRVIHGQLSLNAGISYIGRYNQFHEDEESLQEFLFSPEINFNATYTFPKLGLTVAGYYKHTGQVEQYVFDADAEDFRKGRTNSFNWLDFTTSWKTLKHLTIQAGVKNLLNLTDVNTTSGSAGAHTDAPQSVGLTYGRSYFLKLGYTL